MFQPVDKKRNSPKQFFIFLNEDVILSKKLLDYQEHYSIIMIKTSGKPSLLN